MYYFHLFNIIYNYYITESVLHRICYYFRTYSDIFIYSSIPFDLYESDSTTLTITTLG